MCGWVEGMAGREGGGRRGAWEDGLVPVRWGGGCGWLEIPGVYLLFASSWVDDGGWRLEMGAAFGKLAV